MGNRGGDDALRCPGGSAPPYRYQARIAQQRFKQVRKSGALHQLHDEAMARFTGVEHTGARNPVATALDYLDNPAQSAGSDSELLHELAQVYQKAWRTRKELRQLNLGRDDYVAQFGALVQHRPCE